MQSNDALHLIAARTALVLETNNLRGGQDLELVLSSLRRLVVWLGRQTLGLGTLAQVVITHDGLPAAVCGDLERLAGYPIDFERIGGETGYYEAKNIGFARTDAARCDYVVFADADCLPNDGWLAALLSPFAADPATQVVAGRTSYAATVAGTALTTIDFMYFCRPVAAGNTANFYANNVAFRRSVFDRYRYQRLDAVYRAHCQVLGLRLGQDGIGIHYAPAAHTEHRLPDTRRETLKLRWMRGQDTYGITPFLVRTHAAPALQWLARSGPVGPLAILCGRLVCSLRAVNRQDLPRVRGLRRAMVMAAILGVTAIDMLGAFARGIGINTAGLIGDAQVLSYHNVREAEAV